MKKIALLLIVLSYMSACVKDDIVDDRVDPVLRITNPIDSLTVDSNFQLKALYLDEVGSEQSGINPFLWNCSRIVSKSIVH